MKSCHFDYHLCHWRLVSCVFILSLVELNFIECFYICDFMTDFEHLEHALKKEGTMVFIGIILEPILARIF